MISKDVIKQEVQHFRSFTIHEILEDLDIILCEVDMGLDAMFVNMRILAINKKIPYPYYNFLILHEIGHYILHYSKDASFINSIKIFGNKLEKEANAFACTYFIEHLDAEIDRENLNIIKYLKSCGVPNNIAIAYWEDFYPTVYYLDDNRINYDV